MLEFNAFVFTLNRKKVAKEKRVDIAVKFKQQMWWNLGRWRVTGVAALRYSKT